MSEPSKYDLVSYVSSIDSVMAAMDKISVINRPAWVADEFNRALEDWRLCVEKENEERRKHEAGADPA